MSDHRPVGVEIGAWRKSSFSSKKIDVDECVEVATISGGGRAIRDSKNPTGPMLTFNVSEWAAFASGVKVGEFD